MSIRTRHIKVGGVLYTHDTGNRSLLSDFARELKRRGWKVGGVVQEVLNAPDGTREGVDIVDIHSGDRIAISRPTNESMTSGTCTLDRGALADSTAPLRDAIARNVDLLVVEKFGEREQDGSGLADEILEAVAQGIPTPVSVPAEALEDWNAFSGGMSDLLPSTPEALWRWWGPQNMLRELAHSVEGGPVERIVIGLNWTLIQGPNGVGLAQSPRKGSPGCNSLPDSGVLEGKGLKDLAQLATSWNPFETAIGIAAINAYTNTQEKIEKLNHSSENGLDVFKGVDGPVSIVGRFPYLDDRLPDANIIERKPKDGEFPEHAFGELIGNAEAAIITSSTLIDHSLANIMAAARNTRVALVGPGVPLDPALHSHGIEILSGLLIEDADGAARAVAEGAGAKTLKKFGREITLRAPL